eukprot:CAMPEP_0204918526 /NCGR_PEP_ID=MMETSP1397-20131031/16211_1 /ASSEMBLY_ACC=CAM_ASM_000891 /TAXON_ID=49980 /ORGANISM="Climacostomum Climacostomum virens, Strain Stock W-24" /LENGTH=539 /DNA_ID=CAMNT_0052091849 /DNA_START=255 /DNA_END=1874 /DNA_ORIENTATION=+
MTYDYVLKLMRQTNFDLFRDEAYQVVLQCIRFYPNEITTTCEDIMTLLVKQCKTNPDAITDLELGLLKQMSEALHEQMLTIPSAFDWTEIAKIALDKLLQKGEDDRDDSEVLLLKTLAGLLVRKPEGANRFTKFFLNYVRIRNLWNEHTEILFSRVILAEPKDCFSDIFASLVTFFDEEVTIAQASTLLKMMMETLNKSPETIVTLMITEELRSMFLNIEATIKHSVSQLIQTWARKSDVQSFGKLFKAALRESVTSPVNSLILRQLKKFLREKENSIDRAIYAMLTADLVPAAVECLNASADHRLLEVVHFLCTYSQNFSTIKVSDVTLLFLKIIKILGSLSSEFNSQLLKTLKCSTGIVLALTKASNLKECLHLAQAMKTVVLEAVDTTAHFSLFLFYVFCVRLLVHFDKRSNLKAYCNHLILNSLKGPYVSIMRDKFDLFFTNELQLFVEEDAPLLTKYAYRVPDEALQLDSHVPRTISLNLVEDDSSDQLFDPMGRTPSESEFSSMMSNDTFEGRMIDLHELKGESCNCILCKGM